MRLSSAFLSLSCLAYFVQAADPTCSKGIKSADGKTCCPSYCGRCGGTGCGTLRGGYFECCTEGVRTGKGPCTSSNAPCNIVSNTMTTSDPTCSLGIREGSGKVCCAKSCGMCGGLGCQNRPGGASNCCTSQVSINGKSCSSALAPCNIQTSPAPVVTTTPTGNAKRPVSIAMLPGSPNTDIFARMRQYNVKVDSILMYQNVQYLSWPYLKSTLDAGLKVYLVLEFRDSYPNLWDVAGGKYDGKLVEFFNNVRNDGRSVVVRPLHEFNGDWYSWCALRGGTNSFSAFKAAFRHVSTVIRNTGAKVRIQVSYNILNAKSDPTSFMAQYPGDDVLDEICTSAYNFCGKTKWHSTNRPINEMIDKWYNEISAATNKPLCIAEMSSTNMVCGGKENWIRDTWNKLAYNYPRIQVVTWFLKNDYSLKEDLDLNSWGEITAWREGMAAFKQAVGYTQGDQMDPVTPAEEVAAMRAKEEYLEQLHEKGLEITESSGFFI